MLALAAKSIMWTLFYSPFTFIAVRLGMVAMSVSNRMITKIYLKENGTEVVFYTLNGIKRHK